MMVGFLLDISDWSGLFDFFNFIPQIIYFIFGCCLQVIDFAQLLFRKIIGLDTYVYDGSVAVNPLDFGDGSSGDLVLQIFQKIFLNEGFSILKTAFISMVILGAILLVITTIVAIIRVEYNPNKKPDGKKDYGKGGIIWNMIKAIGAFLAVPIVCYFGIVIGNIALYGIDQASSTTNVTLETLGSELTNNLKPSVTTTSTGSDGTTSSRTVSYDYYIVFGQKASSKFTPMSSIAMRTCLMQANKVRRDSDFYTVVSGGGDTEDATMSFGIFNKYNQSDQIEKTATAIDTVFMLNARLKTPQTINSDYKASGVFNTSGTIEYFDRYDVGLINYYYDLWYFNWPIALLFILIVGKIMISMTVGLLSRVYMIFGLLLFSPIVISLWPIDGGNAIGSWRKKFVSQVLTAYVSVLAFNVFYLIYPVINSFSFFDVSSGAMKVLDYLFQVFFIMAGFLTIKKFDSTFSEMIGGDKEGIMSSGENTWKDMKETGQKLIDTSKGAAVGAGKIAIGTGRMAVGAGKAFGNGIASFSRERRLNRDINKARQTNADINAKTRDKVVGSRKYQKSLNDQVGASMDQKLQNYNEMGGRMDADQIADLTSDVKADWENMSQEQRASFMADGEEYNEDSAKMNYFRDRHKLESALLGADANEYNEYLSKNFTKDYYNNNGTWRKTVTLDEVRRDETESIDAKLKKDIDATLRLGKAQGEFGAFTLKRKEKELKARENARQRIPKLKKKLDNMETSGTILKRSMLNGAKDIGGGVGTMFETAGNVFSSKPKK